jgi:hypothetical protein
MREPTAIDDPDHARWAGVNQARQDAAHHLAVIARTAGKDSALYHRCQEVWYARERDALLSILYRDFANAEVILDHGVHALGQALQVAERKELSLDELSSLMSRV